MLEWAKLPVGVVGSISWKEVIGDVGFVGFVGVGVGVGGEDVMYGRGPRIVGVRLGELYGKSAG